MLFYYFHFYSSFPFSWVFSPRSYSSFSTINLELFLSLKYTFVVIYTSSQFYINIVLLQTSFNFCCCSLAKPCLALCNLMDCSTTVFPVFHYHPEFAQTHVHWVNYAIQPSHPLSLPSPPHPPQSFPKSGFFSSELGLCIRWPKYWRFSFSISPSNKYSGLISLRINWFDLLDVQRLWRVFSSTTVQKHQFISAQRFLWFNAQIHTWLLERP